MRNRTWPIVELWCKSENEKLFIHRYNIIAVIAFAIGAAIFFLLSNLIGIIVMAGSLVAWQRFTPEGWYAEQLRTSEKQVPDDLLKTLAESAELSNEVKGLLSKNLRQKSSLSFRELIEIDDNLEADAETARKKQGAGYKALSSYSGNDQVV